MARQSKYKTQEEKKKANNESAKRWYYNHKNDESFKQKRNEYHRKYYNNLKIAKREYLKSYNTDYSFYVKNVRTGKFEKRIVKTKEELKALELKVFNMEQKLIYIKNKFGHLDNKITNEVNND